MLARQVLEEVSLLSLWRKNRVVDTKARCHPGYLTAKAHTKLSRPEAFDGLRIHTDEINEVITRISPGTLTIAVVRISVLQFVRGCHADLQKGDG